MGEAWGIVTDVILYGGWAILYERLLRLLGQEMHPGREGLLGREMHPGHVKSPWGRMLACALPVLLWRGLIGYCPPVKRFFYGEAMVMADSRATILTTGVGLLALLLAGFFLCAQPHEEISCFAACGRRARRGIFPLCDYAQALYLTLFFGALSELLRFGVYCLTAGFLGMAMDRVVQGVNDGSLAMEDFQRRAELLQGAWALAFLALYLLGLALAVRHCRRAHLGAGRLPRGRELIYLSMAPILSLGVGCLIRMTMLTDRQGQTVSMFDGNAALYPLILAICLLCLCMMLGIVRIWGRIVVEERERGELLAYQSRVADMEQYVGDLERMQDGIRGMKHDLRNYMADIQALMQLGEAHEAQRELGIYLSGMERTLEECLLHCKTGNQVTDVLINRHMRRAAELGASAEWIFRFPQGLGIDPFDLSIILNNGLNNALESLEKLAKERRWLVLSGRRMEQMFLLEIRNAADGEGIVAMGLGMKNMERCARKYRGRLEWEKGEGAFRLTAMLQGGASEDPLCARAHEEVSR